MVDNTEIIKLGASLAGYIGKNSVQTIMDKVRLAKSSKDKYETISELEEIISELISDKNQLIKLGQAYDEQLMMRKISNEDIEYITESVIPLIEVILEESGSEDADKLQENMDIIKPLLSKDTFNILQMLGFNFKQAIGEPLTKLVNEAITSQSPAKSDKELEYNILVEQRTLEYWKVLQDAAAYDRHLRLLE